MAKTFITRGVVTDILDKTTKKDGKDMIRAVVQLEVPGKWNPETKTRPTEHLDVWYFEPKATYVLQAAEYLKGKTVILSYAAGKTGGWIGYDKPTTHGFVRCPAELKPFDEDAIINFEGAFKAMVNAGEIADYEVNPQNINDLLNLYENIAGLEGDLARDLRNCTTRLFFGAKYAFIGPVGSIGAVGNNGAARVSVPLYHKRDEEATWVDITFWDEQPAANLLKIVKPGDTVLFTGLYERPEYNGKRQFSGKYWDLVAHKVQKNGAES